MPVSLLQHHEMTSVACKTKNKTLSGDNCRSLSKVISFRFQDATPLLYQIAPNIRMATNTAAHIGSAPLFV
jgi:hypothetical protein